MKSLLIGLVLVLASEAYAFERPFRIDRYYPTVSGYAVAWGVPGKNLDFERLDSLSEDEIEKELDFSSVRNYIVDIQNNQILTTIENDEMVVFNIAGIHFGNHYSISLDKLAIQNIGYDVDAIGVTENYKWSNNLSKILLVNTSKPMSESAEVDAAYTMNLLREKLKLSILASNMELFENGSENIYKIETKFIENVGDVNVITLDYAFPKQDKNALEVIATVKMKYENGKVTPYILSVKQKQY